MGVIQDGNERDAAEGVADQCEDYVSADHVRPRRRSGGGDQLHFDSAPDAGRSASIRRNLPVLKAS